MNNKLFEHIIVEVIVCDHQVPLLQASHWWKEHYDREYEKEQGLSSKVNKKADRQRYKESFNQAPHSSFHSIPMVH